MERDAAQPAHRLKPARPVRPVRRIAIAVLAIFGLASAVLTGGSGAGALTAPPTRCFTAYYDYAGLLDPYDLAYGNTYNASEVLVWCSSGAKVTSASAYATGDIVPGSIIGRFHAAAVQVAGVNALTTSVSVTWQFYLEGYSRM